MMTDEQAVTKIWNHVVLDQCRRFHQDAEYPKHREAKCGCMRFLARLRHSLDRMLEVPDA